jgi:glycosyltransferase involved in cell wall biosynthesis
MRVLLVSSFVLPHAGGVEQFVAAVRERLEEHGCEVRVLACGRPGGETTADAVVPARYLGAAGWPLPTGGGRTLARELERTDVIVANNAVQPLSSGAVLAGRRRGVPALMVIHGSGDAQSGGPAAVHAGRAAVQRTVARVAVQRSLPVSVSHVGVAGVWRTYGVPAAYLPYPLPDLPPVPVVELGEGEELRLMWIGRLAREKDPLLAVRAVEHLRVTRPARLELYGDGPLLPAVEALAAERPWLTLRGARPWPEVLAAHERAHACLSTSVWDNVQVAVLEALARGVPVVSTQVGDAPSYYRAPELERFCVPIGDAQALGDALNGLAVSYAAYRRAFAANGRELAAVHRDAPRILIELIARVGGRPSRR